MWRRWILVLLVVGVGCGRPQVDSSADAPPVTDAPAADAAATLDKTIITGDRLGPVRVGTTLGELETVVRQTYGDSVTFVPTPNFMGGLDAIAVNQGDEALFYVLHFSAEPLTETTPVRLLLTTNPRFKTPAGVGPGTGLREAEAAYGEATLAHNTENEMRESVRFANFDPASVVFRTNGFAEGDDAAALAGLYDGPVEGSFYETTQYRDDATIRAVMLDGKRLGTSRRPPEREAGAEAAAGPTGDEVSPDESRPSDSKTASAPPASPANADVSYAGADRQLNQTYQAVINTLGTTAQDKLVAAQRAWIALRDEECAFQPLIDISRDSCLTQVTRDRTGQLGQLMADEPLRVSNSLIAGLGTVTLDGGETVNCDDPQGTPSMNYCTTLAYEREDDRLNQIYQAIQSGPKTAATESLVDAQLAWINFRDAHCLSAVHVAYGATGYNAYYAACQAQLTQQRANALADYSNFL
ncbi:MAG: lysozyme inhibitor LprI family protein [Elainellaceae cyanobacterium]